MSTRVKTLSGPPHSPGPGSPGPGPASQWGINGPGIQGLASPGVPSFETKLLVWCWGCSVHVLVSNCSSLSLGAVYESWQLENCNLKFGYTCFIPKAWDKHDLSQCDRDRLLKPKSWSSCLYYFDYIANPFSGSVPTHCTPRRWARSS
jgi:hypothetical protein